MRLQKRKRSAAFLAKPNLCKRAKRVAVGPPAPRQNNTKRSSGAAGGTRSTGGVVFPFPSRTRFAGLRDGRETKPLRQVSARMARKKQSRKAVAFLLVSRKSLKNRAFSRYAAARRGTHWNGFSQIQVPVLTPFVWATAQSAWCPTGIQVPPHAPKKFCFLPSNKRF